MDYAPAILAVKDTTGRFLVMNKAAEKAFGLPASEILGRRTDELDRPRKARARSHHGARGRRQGTGRGGGDPIGRAARPSTGPTRSSSRSATTRVRSSRSAAARSTSPSASSPKNPWPRARPASPMRNASPRSATGCGSTAAAPAGTTGSPNIPRPPPQSSAFHPRPSMSRRSRSISTGSFIPTTAPRRVTPSWTSRAPGERHAFRIPHRADGTARSEPSWRSAWSLPGMPVVRPR